MYIELKLGPATCIFNKTHIRKVECKMGNDLNNYDVLVDSSLKGLIKQVNTKLANRKNDIELIGGIAVMSLTPGSQQFFQAFLCR